MGLLKSYAVNTTVPGQGNTLKSKNKPLSFISYGHLSTQHKISNSPFSTKFSIYLVHFIVSRIDKAKQKLGRTKIIIIIITKEITRFDVT